MSTFDRSILKVWTTSVHWVYNFAFCKCVQNLIPSINLIKIQAVEEFE